MDAGTAMRRAEIAVCNKKGLHARAAAKLVKLAAQFDARIEVLRIDAQGAVLARAGATSILSLLMLGADLGSALRVEAEGVQAAPALDAICALVQRRFEESE